MSREVFQRWLQIWIIYTGKVDANWSRTAIYLVLPCRYGRWPKTVVRRDATGSDWSCCCCCLICIPGRSNWHNRRNWLLLSNRRSNGDLLNGLLGNDRRRSGLELGHDWLGDDRLLLLDNGRLKILDCRIKSILSDVHCSQLWMTETVRYTYRLIWHWIGQLLWLAKCQMF